MSRATSVVGIGRSRPKALAKPTPSRRRAAPSPQVEWARCGDHFAIYHLLRDAGTWWEGGGLDARGELSRDEFQAALDDPFYEPTDRLLIREGSELAAHVQIVKRTMWHAGARLAVGRLAQLVIAPQSAGRGYAAHLVRAAEAQMIEDGAVLGLVTTRSPTFFLRQGWCLVPGSGMSCAEVRRLLPTLRPAPSARAATWLVHASPAEEVPPPLSIRLWKHFELAALQRIYQQNCRHRVGPVERSEEYWHWLIARRAYDRIYVAIEGPDRLELTEGRAHIVGYAVIRDGVLVELFTAPDHPTAASQLLARACADTLERDGDTLSLHAPAEHPLHEVFLTAGGAFHDEAQADLETPQLPVTLAKVLQPQRYLVGIAEVLHRRAAEARLPWPCEWAVCVDGETFALVLSRRSVKVVPRPSSRAATRRPLKLNREQYTRLLLGQIGVSTGEDRQAKAAMSHAAPLVDVLFPRQWVWWTAWDDVPAR